MAAGRLDWREARRALIASGLPARAALALWWPLGRVRRAQRLLQRRRAALEAKNRVVDFLARFQRPLVPLNLTNQQGLDAAFAEPEARALVVAVGASRAMLEEELLARHGGEVGASLDRALAELVREGALLSARPAATGQELYVLSQSHARHRWDLSAINRLLTSGEGYGARLRARSGRDQATSSNRSYDL